MTNRAELIKAIRGLTNKQLVELFYEAVEGRRVYEGEQDLWDSHLVLASAFRDRGADDAIWKIELLCPTVDQVWVDDASICQHGEHCGVETGLDPVPWTSSERWIRCPEWQTHAVGDPADASRMNSNSKPFV